MKESVVQSKILAYLHTLPGCWTVKTIATNKPGTPDILCCYKGHFIAIEVKAPKGVVSKLQKYQIKKLKEAGATAIVAYSVQDVKDFILL